MFSKTLEYITASKNNYIPEYNCNNINYLNCLDFTIFQYRDLRYVDQLCIHDVTNNISNIPYRGQIYAKFFDLSIDAKNKKKEALTNILELLNSYRSVLFGIDYLRLNVSIDTEVNEIVDEIYTLPRYIDNIILQYNDIMFCYYNQKSISLEILLQLKKRSEGNRKYIYIAHNSFYEIMNNKPIDCKEIYFYVDQACIDFDMVHGIGVVIFTDGTIIQGLKSKETEYGRAHYTPHCNTDYTTICIRTIDGKLTFTNKVEMY